MNKKQVWMFIIPQSNKSLAARTMTHLQNQGLDGPIHFKVNPIPSMSPSSDQVIRSQHHLVAQLLASPHFISGPMLVRFTPCRVMAIMCLHQTFQLDIKPTRFNIGPTCVCVYLKYAIICIHTQLCVYIVSIYIYIYRCAGIHIYI